MSRGDALARLSRALEDHGCTVKGSAAQCPAHEDRDPSLSISQGKAGAVLKCHAGCETDAVLEALGLSAADLFDEPREPRRDHEVVATYAYTDEDGEPLFYVERRDPKAFRQYRVVNGRKVWKLGSARLVPYRLPALLAGIAAGATVYIVEGEKDVYAVEAAGGVATCNPMGKGKWRAEYAGYFKGAAKAVIVADRDRDGGGREHAAQVAATLDGIVPEVEIVEAREGKDAADHLAAGHGLAGFRPVEPEGKWPLGLYAPVDWAKAWEAQPEDVDWLIEPFLETGTVNALFAKVDTGKSLLALEWALRLVREGHAVVYVDEENRLTDVVERLQAMGAEPGELDGLRYYFYARLPMLDTAEGGGHLLHLAAACGAALVILDTTTRMVAGRENDADTFLALYRCSLAPLKARGITVLRLDHPGKDPLQGQRGSSAKDGDCDCIFRLTETVKGRRYRIERAKNRSGHAPDAETLDIERRYSSLRHVFGIADREAEIRALADRISAAGGTPDQPRTELRALLAAAGIAASNSLLGKAMKLLRDSPRGSADRDPNHETGGDYARNGPSPPDASQGERTGGVHLSAPLRCIASGKHDGAVHRYAGGTYCDRHAPKMGEPRTDPPEGESP